jgi:hypothetical protein
MVEPSSVIPPSEKGRADRLDSWKEIAAYLNRDVTTAQRWEKREGMPVHRHLHGKMGSVYAPRAELDAWARARSPQIAFQNESAGPSADATNPPQWPRLRTFLTRWTLILPLAVLIVALISGAVLRLIRAKHVWRNPIAGARFQTVTDFDAVVGAAAISRGGAVRRLSIGPGRPDGRVGHPCWFWAIL